MPSMDRRWRWLYGFAALISLMFVLFVLSAHLMDFFAGALFPLGFRSLKWSDLWNGLALLSVVGIAFSLARGSRRRERQRVLALAGEQDALLPARLAPLPAADSLPALAREPLELLWRTRRGPRGVIATNDGLVQRISGKRDRLVRWADARLLEVWFYAFGSDHVAGYALFDGAGNLVEWQDYRQDKAPPAEDGVSFAQMQRRQQTLLALIIAHTGLQPRTLVLDLAELPAAPPSAPVAHRSRLYRVWHWGSLFLLTLAGAPLFVAVAAITLPLTRSLVVNTYVAATMGALGIFLLGFEVRIVAALPRDKRPTPPPFVALPSVPADWARLDQPLRLRGPRMRGQRIVCLMVALLLAGDGYALIRSLFEVPLLNGDSLVSPDDLRRVLIGALFVIVLLGIVICGMGLFERRLVVIADQDGVGWQRGRKREMLPWQLMSHLVAHVSAGKLERFAIAGDDANTTEISWAANARWSPRRATSGADGDADGDAAELAALVARRTGLALTVEDEQ